MSLKKHEMPYTIQALHGFLGTPRDWSCLGLERSLCCHLTAPNLFQDFPVIPFVDWAKEYLSQIAKNASQQIFMGYSLGGRLGLHLILQDPALWKAAIFVSTHSGLSSAEERVARILRDDQWAERFEKESWKSLLQDWNCQGVFQADDFSFERLEGKYCRKTLSKALSVWSLGKQQDLSEPLNLINLPILWMVGADDVKFLQNAKKLKFRHEKSKVCVVPNAAHRLPWQQRKKFLSNVTQFIESLER